MGIFPLVSAARIAAAVGPGFGTATLLEAARCVSSSRCHLTVFASAVVVVVVDRPHNYRVPGRPDIGNFPRFKEICGPPHVALVAAHCVSCAHDSSNPHAVGGCDGLSSIRRQYRSHAAVHTTAKRVCGNPRRPHEIASNPWSGALPPNRSVPKTSM